MLLIALDRIEINMGLVGVPIEFDLLIALDRIEIKRGANNKAEVSNY